MDFFSLLFSYWYFWSLVVIGTVVWMGYESAQHRIPIDSKPYSTNNGAAAWVLSGLLLWIATFPYYFVRRGQFVNKAVPVAPIVPSRSIASELAELNALRDAGGIKAADYERAKSKILK